MIITRVTAKSVKFSVYFVERERERERVRSVAYRVAKMTGAHASLAHRQLFLLLLLSCYTLPPSFSSGKKNTDTRRERDPKNITS